MEISLETSSKGFCLNVLIPTASAYLSITRKVSIKGSPLPSWEEVLSITVVFIPNS